jgi:hypothetical protein
MKVYLAAATIWCIAVGASYVSAQDSGIFVRCSMEDGAYERAYVLYPSVSRAKRVDGAETVEGRLLDLDHVYQLDFPKSDTGYPQRARLFRYTGEIEVEWGMQPFDVYSNGNVFQTGICTASEAVKKF